MSSATVEAVPNVPVAEPAPAVHAGVPIAAPPPAAPTYAPQSSVASAPSASLYVGELDPTVTEAMLFEIFNMIGPVARCELPRNACNTRIAHYIF